MVIEKHSAAFYCWALLCIFSLFGMLNPAYSESGARQLKEDAMDVLDLSALLENIHAGVTNAALNKYRKEERPDILARFRQTHGPFFEYYIASVVRAFPEAFSDEELSRIIQAEKSGDLTGLGQELSTKLLKKMEKVKTSVGGLTSLYIRQANEGDWERYADPNQHLCTVLMAVGTGRKWVKGELIDAAPVIENITLSYQKGAGYGAGFTVSEENFGSFPKNADIIIAVGGSAFVAQRYEWPEIRKLAYSVSAEDASKLLQLTDSYEYIFVYKRHRPSDVEYLAKIGSRYGQGEKNSVYTVLEDCVTNLR